MRKQVDTVNHLAGNAPAVDADELIEAVHAVMHQFRARQFRALREGAHELSHMEAKALGYFARHPGATQSELVQHSGRDKGQVARLIATLRERGYLEARADEADRRIQRLEVSAAGRAVQKAIQAQGRKLSQAAVAGLSAEECAQLKTLLAKLQQQLDELP
ncbi:MarR family winged helix-turn-helix transcriptional regulator [Pelomonas sp. KK5]|uniref:MarR family winged helix-turn-helix transcriptional regulator n=1 Tax=Pelomonas sp. KK5 TaxID=1855730 RepID=UPI00097BCB4B|nr:MarR family transcriptional regulator [Pelomonas sp. KK5]